MNAIVFPKYGKPDVFTKTTAPFPHGYDKASNVLIKVSAASINPVDKIVISGGLKLVKPVAAFPHVASSHSWRRRGSRQDRKVQEGRRGLRPYLRRQRAGRPHSVAPLPSTAWQRRPEALTAIKTRLPNTPTKTRCPLASSFFSSTFLAARSLSALFSPLVLSDSLANGSSLAYIASWCVLTLLALRPRT